MKALFLKDILHQKWVIVFGGFYSLFFFLLFALAGDSLSVSFIYPLVAVAVGYMILLGSFKADKNDTPVFMLSLPISKRDWVNGKFLLLLAAVIYGMVTTAILGALALLPFLHMADRWIVPIDLVRIFIGMGLFSGILPFYFAFGQKAVRYAVVALVALGVVIQLALLVSLSVAGQETGHLIDLVIAWFTSIPMMKRNLAFALVATIILAGSYLFSIWYFPRKDL